MRPIVWTASAALFFACSPKSDSGGTPDTDGSQAGDGTAGTADGTDGTGSLNGTPPEEPIPLPSFAATNRDGSARSRDDLLGHPTVMWFYPLAASAG